jgi:hypothetical protein
MVQGFEARGEEESAFVAMVEGSGLVRSESMEITNDPRFFTGNVIDKRLSAFHLAGMVSVIMLKVAMGNLFTMKKDISYDTLNPWVDNDGLAQLIGFILLTLTLFLNIITVYVTIAQIYHTYRLMTAGPTGFEMATAYYLNRNIIFWRHFSLMCMFISFPIVLISCGLRMLVRFDKESIKKATHVQELKPQATLISTPVIGNISVIGLCVMMLYVFMSCFLWCIHQKHVAVFRERYAAAVAEDSGVTPLRTHVQELTTRGKAHGYLDV